MFHVFHLFHVLHVCHVSHVSFHLYLHVWPPVTIVSFYHLVYVWLFFWHTSDRLPNSSDHVWLQSWFPGPWHWPHRHEQKVFDVACQLCLNMFFNIVIMSGSNSFWEITVASKCCCLVCCPTSCQKGWFCARKCCLCFSPTWDVSVQYFTGDAGRCGSISNRPCHNVFSVNQQTARRYFCVPLDF